ncbi:hypothetical protein DFQ28_010092 [Apophysomyces sp. BC1034]|nr:hypothetical protein DFQ29_008543 [Apophysomyces sp. BC1021]KAG0185016.1 hypothetical protein DFQ28_010092 [Apophysomyces sp. BC1034]
MHKEAALFEDDEWHGMLDHHPTRIDSKEERALVRRLDKRLLLFAMFGNLVKMLDNANLGSAFISGMEEELGIAGVQYNWMGVYFMLGYLFMQVPSNLLLARLRPSIYLPSLEMFWCFLTLAMATVQSVRGVFVIRVLLGLAEAGFYPGERQLAMRRLEVEGRESKRPTTRNLMACIRSLLTNRYLIPFIIGWAAVHVSLGATTVLGIVARKLGYDAVTANLITTPDMLITMVATLCNGFISDKYRTRLWCIVFPAVLGLLGCSMLSTFVQPFGLLYVGFLLTNIGLKSTTSVIMTWASEIISQNIEVRALAIGVMNTAACLTWTWTPLVLWPVTDAPYYHTGFRASVFSILIFIISMGVIGYRHSLDQPIPSSATMPMMQINTMTEEDDDDMNAAAKLLQARANAAQRTRR